MMKQIEQLELLLQYTFTNRLYVEQALTHTSYLNEAMNSAAGDYQRLEFLGDAVLGLLLAEMLFTWYPDWTEGALSQLRSRLAGQDILADRARLLGLGDYVRLGRGEELTSGRQKDSILADVIEALIAALYLDGGLSTARVFVCRLFEGLVAAPENLTLGRDAKSELQEYLSARDYAAPEYRLLEESGPPHDRLFCFQVLIGERIIGHGQGKSKKSAQQAAAVMALDTLKIMPGSVL